MKPRARRVTIVAAALGAGVVATLTVVHWGAIRDHVTAWHFQLTKETETIAPERGWQGLESTNLLNKRYIRLLANCSGRPVVVEPATDPAFGLWLIISTEGILQALRESGLRVIEQGFPWRAYVVIRDPATESRPTGETLLMPFGHPDH